MCSQNVDKAKKQIEALEKDETANGANGVNGDDKVEQVASDLKDASIDDKKDS